MRHSGKEATQVELSLVSQLGRRRLLMGAGFLAGAWATNQLVGRQVMAAPKWPDYPFQLGVASGDPLPDSVVLWTRLAPDPLNGGGMPPVNVPVRWQIATDAKFQNVVQSGEFMALPELAHSVHMDVRGLEPATRYWYQFAVAGEISPVGQTLTAPRVGQAIPRLRFAFASCQDWQSGYYTAYRYMAQEDLDLVIHLGDYIYEYGPLPGFPREHNGPEILTLEDYRNRYALYKSDSDLQAAHAAFPWIVTWDDHEVENNYADAISENRGEPAVTFLERRAIAYQAYYEHMPLREVSRPIGPDMQLYRRFTLGDLVQLNVLDTRQYRTDQPCNDLLKPRCATAFDPAATMTGTTQEEWLFNGLDQSQSRWNIIAQQTMLAEYDYDGRPGSGIYNMDQWDGYVAARDRILSFLADRRPANPVVITGDIHSSWVHDLKQDFSNRRSATIGTEFVGTSISSTFPARAEAAVQAARPDNPHTRFFDGENRGYVRCVVTPRTWQSDYQVVSTVANPNGSLRTLASFVVEDGVPGAQRLA